MRARLVLLVIGVAACAPGVPLMAQQPASDVISHPPDVREFTSASGGFVFRVGTNDKWKSGVAVAELLVPAKAGAMISRWRKPLPHFEGPRRVLVSDNGYVALFDDWINSPSPRSIMVLDSRGNTVAIYTFEALVQALGVTPRIVADSAHLGIWLTTEPQLSPDRTTVILRAGGHTLALSLNTGKLERTR
jgi:hypothetical protein